MISTLRGIVSTHKTSDLTVEVGGVGYRLKVPQYFWDMLRDGDEYLFYVSPYIREDQFTLYGFDSTDVRTTFECLIKQQGIGPKAALDILCAPRSLLIESIIKKDANMLSSIKGIGKKRAEKIIVDLQSLLEKDPTLFGSPSDITSRNTYDADVIEALTNLGFHTPHVLKALESVPKELTTTEERVSHALRALS
jgi:holliday junction DNA helicase RuvA